MLSLFANCGTMMYNSNFCRHNKHFLHVILVIKDENVSFLSWILPGKVQSEFFRNYLVICVVIFIVVCFQFFFFFVMNLLVQRDLQSSVILCLLSSFFPLCLIPCCSDLLPEGFHVTDSTELEEEA